MDVAIWASLNSKPAESYALYAGIETRRGSRLCNACMVFMQGPGRFVPLRMCSRGDRVKSGRARCRVIREYLAMRLTIEIAAAAFLLFCITASSAAFAAGMPG